MMTVIKEDDWTEPFDGTKFVPGQVGVYRTLNLNSSWGIVGFQYWNGQYWGQRWASPLRAYLDDSGISGTWQSLPFQGLKKEFNG